MRRREQMVSTSVPEALKDSFSQEIGAVARSLFDRVVEVEAARPEEALDELFPAERLHIERAVRTRQAEFATGRVCARRVLRRLGIQPGPLLPDLDHSPLWPSGVVGSISHTTGVCIVVVARASVLGGIGIDVEQRTPLSGDLERMVTTSAEQRWLDRQDARERGKWSKLVFSAKESFYKCQHTTTRLSLDFADVELDLNPHERSFSARIVGLSDDRLQPLRDVRGRWTWWGDYVITGSSLAR
jgi:4'-phosphopantetheinyl transferase EntD